MWMHNQHFGTHTSVTTLQCYRQYKTLQAFAMRSAHFMLIVSICMAWEALRLYPSQSLLSYKAYNTQMKEKTNCIQQLLIYYTHIKTHKTSHWHTSNKIHTITVSTYLSTRRISRLIQATSSSINTSEASLTKGQCRTLSQLRINYYSFCHTYTTLIIHTIQHHSVNT